MLGDCKEAANVILAAVRALMPEGCYAAGGTQSGKDLLGIAGIRFAFVEDYSHSNLR